MSAAHWQLDALETAHTHLVRLHDYEAEAAGAEGREPVTGWLAGVVGWRDLVAAALERSRAAGAVAADDVAVVQRIAPWLATAVRRLLDAAGPGAAADAGERYRILLEVDAIPHMITGMDPREVDEAWRVLGTP